jgi:hypothetical protein
MSEGYCQVLHNRRSKVERFPTRLRLSTSAATYWSASVNERAGKGAPRRAHQSVSGSSDVPLSAAQDRGRRVFLHACAGRPWQRSV